MLVSCYHVELFSSLLVYSLDFTVTFVRMLVLEQVNHVHYRSIVFYDQVEAGVLLGLILFLYT